MTDLESQIRGLALRNPGDTLDQRVFSSLQSVNEEAANQSSAQRNEPILNESWRRQRGFFSITISGIVAALLIGVAIGNNLPSIWTQPEQSAGGMSTATRSIGSHSSADQPDFLVPDTESESFRGHPMIPNLPGHVREALMDRGSRGSQFVESSYESARAGAGLWERENGEVFNMATHVSDRRFDMCRDCHRIGG